MGFFSDLMGDNQDAYNDYADQMRQHAGQYQPWIDTGRQGLGRYYGESDRLLSNPNAVQDQIASGFYESPYQQLMQDRVQKRMNYNAANTGMLGSGAANRAMQDELTGMTGQFMNDYINRGMSSYGMGFSGMGALGQQGLGALNDMTPLMENAAGAELQGERSRQGAMSNLFGNVIGGLGSLATLPFGGVGGLGAQSLLQRGMGAMFGSGSGGGATGQPFMPRNDDSSTLYLGLY